MGLFSIFGKKGENNSAVLATLPVVDQQETASQTVVEQQQSSASQSDKPLRVSYATGWPIDVIYGYLHKNYEEKGLEDAMLNADIAFRDLNMSIIRNKILMVFREINLNYDVKKNDLEIRMETCRNTGLLTTVAELEKSMTTINAHKEELKRLEEDFRNNANEASIPLQSYSCGFLRGIAIIALSGTSKATVIPQMATKPSENAQMSA